MSAGAPKKPADGFDREKNEYIPAFITKKPFWVPEDDDRPITDYLEHQRLSRKDEEQQQKWYDRGKRAGPAATKYRKGACENCGSMTHKTKECLSRKRTKGAKWTGKNIAQDEVIDEVKMGWDAKRDRWNGYDASEYSNVVRDFEELDRLKHEVRPADEKTKDEDGADGDDDDGARYAEESEMGRQQSTATRNLRMREDTAKYLLNLDPDSAKYDPKSRSMVDGNPDPNAAMDADEGFMRPTSDAAEFERAQKFAWETQERGDSNRIHIQANPTSADYTRRKLKEESDAKRVAHQKQLVDKYGAQTEVSKASALRQTAVTENEVFVEYDKYGTVKTQGKASTKSKYAEDVYINNHTSVWGSYWKDFTWGYACCHSFIKNSYCVGMAAVDEGVADEAQAGEETVEDEVKEAVDTSASVPSTKAKKRAAAAIDESFEQEMEAYKKARASGADPMKGFLGRDEIVH